MIRIETSRQTAATFKTEKGALNRVARDAEWFANAAEEGTQGVVEVRGRWDEEAARTLFDVDYVVYAEVAPQDVPEGAQGHVSGSRQRIDRGRIERVPYGYAARVEGVHTGTGRLRLFNHTGTLVQREDEVLTLLPTTDLQGTHYDDARVAEHIAAQEAEEGLGECPRCGGTTYSTGEGRSCQDCPYETLTLTPVAPAAAAAAPAALSAAPGFGVVPAGYDVVVSEWSLRCLDETTGQRLWLASAPTLTYALDLWRHALEAEPLALLQVLHNGAVYADVREYDTCSVHRDAVFSKDGPCPVCVEEDDAAQGRPCDACGALPLEECRPGCIGLASEQDDLQRRTVRDLRGLLSRDDLSGSTVLTDLERSALRTAIDVLED